MSGAEGGTPIADALDGPGTIAPATAAFGTARLVVAPGDGGGVVGAALPALRSALTARGVAHDVVEVGRGWRAGERAAAAAMAEGRRYVVAVGGDDLVHGVVNALVPDEGAVPDVVMGVATCGSGGDFIKTWGLDRAPEVVARHLASASTLPVDVGVVTCSDRRGAPVTRRFANVAHVGWTADVARRAAHWPRALGRVRHLLGAYGAMLAAATPRTEVEVAHTTTTVPLLDLVVANGQFVMGGAKVAPRALPDDGRFAVLAFTGGRSQVFTMIPAIHRAEHLPDPGVTEYQSPTVAVRPARPLHVEADGQVVGRTPATFRLRERALRLKT